jgi:hypothetical protein
MSVRTRIEDAEFLYKNGRKDGALLSILIALAATSRKRYPKVVKEDRDAFTAFLGEELTKRIGVGKFKVKFRNKMILLQDLFYKFVRCELAHEAQIPEDIKFTKGDMLHVRVDEKEISLSERFIDILFNIVIKAEENKEEFNDILEKINQS